MVLHRGRCGRVGRRRTFIQKRPPRQRGGPFCVQPPGHRPGVRPGPWTSCWPAFRAVARRRRMRTGGAGRAMRRRSCTSPRPLRWTRRRRRRRRSDGGDPGRRTRVGRAGRAGTLLLLLVPAARTTAAGRLFERTEARRLAIATRRSSQPGSWLPQLHAAHGWSGTPRASSERSRRPRDASSRQPPRGPARPFTTLAAICDALECHTPATSSRYEPPGPALAPDEGRGPARQGSPPLGRRWSCIVDTPRRSGVRYRVIPVTLLTLMRYEHHDTSAAGGPVRRSAVDRLRPPGRSVPVLRRWTRPGVPSLGRSADGVRSVVRRLSVRPAPRVTAGARSRAPRSTAGVRIALFAP